MYETLHDCEARIAAMYPIHAMGDIDSPPDWLEEFLDGCGPKDLAAIVAACPELLSVAEPNDFDRTSDMASAFAEQWTLHSRSGYIVRAEICVRRYMGKTSSFYSGWGIVQLYWIYVESADEAVARVTEIANQQHQTSEAKAGEA
ncbi:hypothetical protein RHI9324_01255 [Rhizobium sp. CECT 9324]|nr:hypothetical protein RHI9324_01255 [Rhizobium sp. CECT 9324]